ncbi:DUF3592 domain-containing protein [Streptomyces sp. NPDC021212]|uniref:DUF3592 domain-containing protein n=1 Tax=Streptomyces sp. NPDC021212 TaxID=3365118 RepID=UPI003798C231
MRLQVRGRGARRWITFGAIAFGTVFLAVGLIMAGASVSFLKDADRAPGTVVALEWRNDDSGTSRRSREHDEPVAYPVVEYRPTGGTRTTFRSSVGSNPPSYERGERVGVLYHADSPEDARIDGFASLWLMPLIFGGIGLVCAGIGTAVAVVGRPRS